MWVDAELKRLQVRSLHVLMISIDNRRMSFQPYVDLVHGGSPAQKSLLLDYTRVQCVSALKIHGFH